jgi:hypothetical protein
LPSTATISGSLSRRLSTQAEKHSENIPASSPLITSFSASWEGMPRLNGNNCRRNASFIRPQRVVSTKLSAPASVAHSTRTMISGSGYSTFHAWRGSSSAEK